MTLSVVITMTTISFVLFLLLLFAALIANNMVVGERFIN